MTVDVYDPPHHIPIGAESARPQSVPQNDVRIGIQRLILFGVKRASHCSMSTEDVEIIFGGDDSPNALRRRVVTKTHVHAGELKPDKSRKRVVSIAIVFVVRIGTGMEFAARHYRLGRNKAARIGDSWQRIKKDRADPAKHGGIPADADGK